MLHRIVTSGALVFFVMCELQSRRFLPEPLGRDSFTPLALLYVPYLHDMCRISTSLLAISCVYLSHVTFLIALSCVSAPVIASASESPSPRTSETASASLTMYSIHNQWSVTYLARIFTAVLQLNLFQGFCTGSGGRREFDQFLCEFHFREISVFR